MTLYTYDTEFLEDLAADRGGHRREESNELAQDHLRGA